MRAVVCLGLLACSGPPRAATPPGPRAAVSGSPVAHVAGAAGSDEVASGAPAPVHCDPRPRLVSEALRLGFALYPTASDGLAPHAKLPLYDIACDVIGRPPAQSRPITCAATTKPRAAPRHLDRCFTLDRRPVPAAALAAVRARADELDKTMDSNVRPIDVPFPDGGIAIVHVDTHWDSPELDDSGGCGPRRPGQPICDPMPGRPTGRTLHEASESMFLARAPSRFARDAFQPTFFESYWIEPGTATYTTSGNVTSRQFVPDPELPQSPNISSLLADPAGALRSLAHHSPPASDEVAVALLLDTALAEYALHDRARGREATAKLEAFLAAHPCTNTEAMLFETSLETLRRLGADGWTLDDPCRP